jgi:hypothetical protein
MTTATDWNSIAVNNNNNNNNNLTYTCNNKLWLYRVSSLWPSTNKADKLILQPCIFYDNLPFLTVTLTTSDMLAAVQTRHMFRTSGIIPWSAGHLCLLALSEAAHGTFGNTQHLLIMFLKIICGTLTKHSCLDGFAQCFELCTVLFVCYWLLTSKKETTKHYTATCTK